MNFREVSDGSVAGERRKDDEKGEKVKDWGRDGASSDKRNGSSRETKAIYDPE